jgi:hypothetical protein
MGTFQEARMIVFVDGTVQISIGKWFVVFSDADFTAAIKRGKALRRAQEQRAREAQAQDAADRKRDRVTGLVP